MFSTHSHDICINVKKKIRMTKKKTTTHKQGTSSFLHSTGHGELPQCLLPIRHTDMGDWETLLHFLNLCGYYPMCKCFFWACMCVIATLIKDRNSHTGRPVLLITTNLGKLMDAMLLLHWRLSKCEPVWGNYSASCDHYFFGFSSPTLTSRMQLLQIPVFANN